MKIREKSLLKLLLGKIGYQNIKAFSDNFKVTQRTIRNDIVNINGELFEVFHKFPISIKNNNVTLILSDEERNVMEKIVYSKDHYVNKLSNKERIAFIIIELIRADDFVTFHELAEKLYVSRGTIVSDMKQVKEWCREKGVTLISKKSHGLILKANEKEKRNSILLVIRDLMGSLDGSTHDYKKYAYFFRHVDIEELKECIILCEDKFDYHLSDISFEGLLIHVALSVERNLENSGLTKEKKRYEELDTIEYQFATELISVVEERYHLKLQEDEISYISSHLIGRNVNIPAQKNEETYFEQIKLQNFIRCVFQELPYKEPIDDMLLLGLMSHYQTAKIRIKENKMLENPLKKMLLCDYPELFCAIKKNLYRLFSKSDVSISVDEIAYIVLHFAAEIRTHSKKDLQLPKVIIACATGAGTSQILWHKLTEVFNFHIVGITSIHKLSRFVNENEVELIITTAKIQSRIPSILVSPLLKSADIINIKMLVEGMGFMNFYRQSDENKRLSALPERMITLLLEFYENMNEDEFEEQLCKLIEESSLKKGLSKLLNKEHIELNVRVKHWEEAIWESGRPLLLNHCINKKYVEQTIENIHALGPYAVLGKGVAMPHAQCIEHVQRTSMSYITLKEPVRIKGSEPVKHIFMLATKDERSHLKALKELLFLLDDEEFFTKMQLIKNKDDVYEYIAKYTFE